MIKQRCCWWWFLLRVAVSVVGGAARKHGNRRPNPEYRASACVATLYSPIFTYRESVGTPAFQLVCGDRVVRQYARRRKSSSRLPCYRILASDIPKKTSRKVSAALHRKIYRIEQLITFVAGSPVDVVCVRRLSWTLIEK
ncbi:hypothetical protein Trydic_g902 [Trypoxylus dichotomus]